MTTPITDTQVRAARELLRWDQKKLAEEASLGLATVKRYETGHQISEEALGKIVKALAKGGILFVGTTTIDGRKVKSAVALTPRARPEPRPETRQYEYTKPAGRPRSKTT